MKDKEKFQNKMRYVIVKYSHFIALIFHFLRELWFIGLELGRKVWATSYETFQNMYFLYLHHVMPTGQRVTIIGFLKCLHLHHYSLHPFNFIHESSRIP